jgi:hypothetical protein
MRANLFLPSSATVNKLTNCGEIPGHCAASPRALSCCRKWFIWRRRFVLMYVHRVG